MSIRTVPGRTRICTEELDGLMYSHEAILSELDNSVGLRQVDSAEEDGAVLSGIACELCARDSSSTCMPPNVLFDVLCIFHSVTDIIARAVAIQARQSSATLQRKTRVKLYEQPPAENAAKRPQPKKEIEPTGRPLGTNGTLENLSPKYFSKPSSARLALSSACASLTPESSEPAPSSRDATLPPSIPIPVPLPQSHILAQEKAKQGPSHSDPNVAILSAEVG